MKGSAGIARTAGTARSRLSALLALGALLLAVAVRVAPAQQFAYVSTTRVRIAHGAIRALAFAPDGTWLVAAAGRQVLAFALGAGGNLQPRGEAPGLRSEPEAVAVSPDGKTLAVVDRDGGLYLYRVSGVAAPLLSPLASVPRAHKGRASTVAFTGDGSYVLTGGADRKVRVWTPAGTPFADLGRKPQTAEILAVIPLGNRRQMLSVSKDGRITLWQVDTQEPLRPMAIDSDVLSAAAGIRGTTLALGLQSLRGNLSRFAQPTSLANEIDAEDLVRLIDANTGVVEHNLEGERQDLAAVAVTPDGRFVAAGGSAAVAAVWDARSGKRIARIPCEQAVSALAFSPDGRWMLVGSGDGSLGLFGLHGVEPGVPPPPPPPQPILLALLEPSGVADPADGGSTAGPGSRGQVPRVTALTLRVRGRIQTSSPLKSLLVDGQEITSLSREGSDGYLFTAYVELPAAGEHRVEVVASNDEGASIHRAFVVERTAQVFSPLPGPGRRLALIVGVSHYADRSLDLAYAAADARALHDLLVNPALGPAAFRPEDVRLLLDEQATVSAINTGLREFLRQARENDFVLFYFAGHGAPDPRQTSDLYLLAHDTSPKNIAGTGLLMVHVREAIAKIPARDVLILSDACHSAGIGGTGGRSIEVNPIHQSFTERMRHASGGLAILTASEAAQLSQEDARWGHHGVFTYFLLRGLAGEADRNGDHLVTLGELMEYVRENVSKATRYQQVPAIGNTIFDRALPLVLVPEAHPKAGRPPAPRP
jgi:WD40 repeat protein/uncharacterized caspase-like protein